jgi:hypothetical protein
MPTKLKFPLQKQAVGDEVHRWFDCLAIGNYKAAYDLTFHDQYYEWTPKLIENIINGYGLPHEQGETKYVVTDWRTASGKDRGGELDLYDKHVESGGYTQLGHAYYEVPLNGEWSDLSAVFRIVKYEDGAALLLEEIHVL